MLSNQSEINLNEYIELDNYVAEVLGENFSEIVEVKLRNKIIK